MLRLITIPISHYCEKARWALDRAGFSYHEERHVQGVHQLVARRAGGGMTVPVLVTPERTIGDSAEILTWVDARTGVEDRLFPDPSEERARVERLCLRFDEVLGPRGRRLMYVHMLPRRELALQYNNVGVPSWEDRTVRFGWPFARAYVSRVLGIRSGIEVEDEATVFGELDFVADLLADGRPHLCGERFSAADLTFAALCAPLVVPPEYRIQLPQPDDLPPQLANLAHRAREHPAGRYALALFSDHR